MKEFFYSAPAARIVFGAGSLQHLEREIELLGAQRALVLSTPEQAADAERVARRLGRYAVGVFAKAAMHVPIETAREARVEAQRLGADCAVATSGMNAIAHATEGLYAKDGNPIMDLMAAEGIRAIAAALPALRARPSDLEARAQALYGAWLCGTVLGNVGMALHHKFCHTLGGSFNLPHAEVHTVILPHAVAYNAAAVPLAMSRIATALEASSAAGGLYDLARAQSAPYTLRDIGMRRQDLDRAADLAAANPYWNPRPIEREAIRELLQRAYDGVRPH